MVRRANKLGSFIFVGIRHGQQNAPKTGPPHLIFRREIRAAKKGLSVWEQEAGQGPAALARDGADGGLITCIDVWALIAIHFHCDKILINNFRDLGILITLAVDDVAPVAPHGANIQKNGLVFGFRASKGRIAPLVPVNGLVRRGT
jgi:hypothetical protein